MARSSATPSHSTTTLAQGTEVRGRVSGEGDLSVLGSISGEISLKGALFVGEGGTVKADVQASSVQVDGVVEGDISATGAVVLGAGAQFHGDIQAKSLIVIEGASVTGRIDVEFDLPPELHDKGSR